MLEWLRTPAAIVFVFGIVIFVHELGHFIAAKLTGVYAPRFSIGFGPALWSHKWGETEYILAALPLGGYVRMASREDESMAFIEGGSETPAAAAGGSGAPAIVPTAKPVRYYDPNGMAPFGPRPVPENRWLESKPLIARLFIMLAGVTMNFMLGFLIIAGIFITAGETVYQTREIGDVAAVPAGDTSFQSLAAGNVVLAVDGHAVQTWNDVTERIATDSSPMLVIQTNRGTTTIPVQDSGAHSRVVIASTVLRPFLPAVVGQVVSGRAGDRAGLQVGDSITAVNGAPVRGWFGLVRQIESSPGKALTLSVMRKGSSAQISVIPDSTPNVDLITQHDTVVGKIGAGLKDVGTRKPIATGEAIKGAWLTTWANAGVIVHTLRGLISGHQSVKGLAGPIGVGVQAKQAAELGWTALLSLLALLSINLAVVNLVPIPILDGGQILIMLAEAIKGDTLAARTRVLLFYGGFSAIVLLFSIVTFNDLSLLSTADISPVRAGVALTFGLVALALLGVSSPASAQETAYRFEITSVGDSTVSLSTDKHEWVRAGQKGIAVDPMRHDALVARFVILTVDEAHKQALAIVTGQTTRLTTSHVALIDRPSRSWYQQPTLWIGAVVGAVIGVIAKH